MKLIHYYLIALGVIIVDQIAKYLTHNYMTLGEEIHIIGDVLKLHYITNSGMAFGITLGGLGGKLFLSTFRLLAMFGIGYYLKMLFDKKSNKGLLVCVALILGGAIGNVIDSTIYGVLDQSLLIDDAPSKWLYGKVVDMVYIDIASGYYPDWIPMMGGDYYSFWPIFNLADSSIFIGITIILIFQKKFFTQLG